ncbi:hypothetical protein [Pseudomonas sp. ICMP 460]|uniref:hypothetical protein n=1 Tax=Pseudomonas sp. ICMP 460 TaxID=1718917 RepID=UPI000C06E209|nr:hypothetical protein [Pseudomonas sp. ICMP 460]PHN26246.1 hypothetical protein AO240_08120 [Pseudomonas sp. ICMP 460]
MKHVIRHLVVLGTCLALTVGCSASEQSNTFTFTADLPPGFAYVASVSYVPVSGQSCNLGRRDNLKQQFNREWRTEYKPDAQIEIRRTRKGCELVINGIELEIKAAYGKDRGDFGGDSGFIAVRDHLNADDKRTFSAAGESQFSGECQWFFRTIGPKRYITKILYCRSTDAQGNVTKGRPFAAYTLDQLPGKTVKLNIKLAYLEKPAVGDTWVKVPGGWKRCMGDNFEDQYAFCYGNYRDFSSFKMPDGRSCTIYPGCTENKEVTP